MSIFNTNLFYLGAFLALLSIIGLISCTDQTNKANTSLQNVRIASVPAVVEAPTHIAYDNGYFKQEGLDIRLSINPDGKTSLTQLLNGDVDIAAVTATPVVYSSLQGNNFVIFGNVDHSKIHFVVARQDRGITSITDLKGRKVAVMLGTSGQFFMDSLLTLNHMSSNDMEVIDMNAPAQVKAFVNGEIDAMFCWVPFPFQALHQLEGKATLLPSKLISPSSWVIVTTKEYIKHNPDVPAKILKGLASGQKFINEHRAEAFDVYSKISGVKNKINKALFDDMNFGLSLNHSLLLDFEEQARWIIKNGYTDSTEIPNYLDYFDVRPMQEVAPEAATLIY